MRAQIAIVGALMAVVAMIGATAVGHGWQSARPDNARKIDGTDLRALLAAYQKFEHLTEIPAAKKKIENYSISVTDSGDAYDIVFLVKRNGTERYPLGGETELGMDVRFRVSRKTYKVIGYNFFE